MKLFNLNKAKFDIKIPKGIQQEWFIDKVRFIGSKNDLYPFIKEFRRLYLLKNGDKVKLGKLTLKVSDFTTEDTNKINWIEMSNDAWNIMTSKFYDSWEGYDKNPFDFNNCGYTDKNPFDIGIEITDLPLSDEVLFDLPHLKLLKSENTGIYLLIDDTELLDFIEDYLIEENEIDYLNLVQSVLDGKNKYRLNFDSKHEQILINALTKLTKDEINRIWNLNNE